MRNHSLLIAGALASLVGCSSGPSVDAGGTTVVARAADPLAAALAGSHRPAADAARDGARHPRETLEFFGVRPDHTVVELWPGRTGWYTQILAPVLRDEGRLVAIVPEGPYLAPYAEFLATRPDVYDRVQLRTVVPAELTTFGEDGTADAVLTFRSMHGMYSNGHASAVAAAAFRVLRPGGVFGVVDHRGDAGMTDEQIRTSGYIPVATVVSLVTAAGFELEAQSEINANPRDDHDHPNGVWSLPPSLRGGEVDRETFVAIGESDRMTLRFRKPR